MKKEYTCRGFSYIGFKDVNNVSCSLQKSSVATEDLIWLGCNKAEPKTLIRNKGWVPITIPKEYVANTRMHLSREQVAKLLPNLVKFVETGEL